MGWNFVIQAEVAADKSVVCFGEAVTYTGRMKKAYTSGSREGEVEDISDEIVWRNDPSLRGRTYTKVWESRKNTRVSIYYEEWPVAHADVTVICCALGRDFEQTGYSEDELHLARMILGEGSTCSTEEKVAIGYVAANRMRFDPGRFGGSVKQVVTRRGQFLGMGVSLARRTATGKAVRDLSPKECAKLREALEIAHAILSDTGSLREPLFTQTGRHAMYFNQSRALADRPDGELSPRIHRKGESGFTHSFYTSARKPK
jgi:hypothetical protein